MVDLEWKQNMLNSKNISPKSPKLSLPFPTLKLPLPLLPNDISTASSTLCTLYDNYLRLPHLKTLWASNNFPNWANEPIIKPALHALEITFRLISTVSSDPRPYVNKREWARRAESLAKAQIQLISILCEDEEHNPNSRGNAPVTDVSNISQIRSYSEQSLLPKLATWQKSKDIAQRILSTVEYEMMRCPYTLGLGEPNFNGKKILRYDDVCKPNLLHSLETTPFDHVGNYENRTLHATHQIMESWTRAARVLMDRVNEAIDGKRFEKAASELHAVEKIWKVLIEIEDMHLMMDPEDFLKLKKQLGIRKWNETVPFCFRSKELVEIMKMSRELKGKVPEILEVEVDPTGGPGVMEEAMKVYLEKKSEKVHVLQAMQGIELVMKRFFFAYKQVVTVMMGTTESNSESLSQIFFEPTSFPSLDAAKTFLGYYLENYENTIHW
ncbi:nematode resistance protein-like HSPRO2 [Cicer arietinum]|uniref:Nematode resistance protein-like HSPRO2 n=1 Tax=Cicer arietinum TaxID=3827 RepID=A0A1S3E0B8_CICAR|nr:nematode resistance protein-like HSPRO2 [Cicer arietinum]